MDLFDSSDFLVLSSFPERACLALRAVHIFFPCFVGRKDYIAGFLFLPPLLSLSLFNSTARMRRCNFLPHSREYFFPMLALILEFS